MNYLFYDYETSGRNEVYDQIFQFGAIKTDAEFNQIGEPIEFFCKLRRDILPSPAAIKVNQIDIDELNSKGLTEFEFAKKVAETLLGDGNQCVVGYNTKSFDNKFTRFLLYRNFLNPYAWSYLNGNTCFDIFDVMSLGYSFDRLANIKLGAESDRPLRLENIAKINNLSHDDAHNAISDVKATIQLAKLLKDNSPKLYEYALSLKSFDTAKGIVSDHEKFFHSSSLNSYDNKFLSLHTGICGHPLIQKSAIGWNLKCDPREILGLTPDEIRDQMYSKKESRTVEVGFNEFKLNQSPMVVKFYDGGETVFTDYDLCIANLNEVKANLSALTQLAKKVYDSSVPEVDPDADLYVADFFRQADTHASVFNDIRANPLAVDSLQIRHVPFKRMFSRLKARNFFEELGDGEKAQYIEYCENKFSCSDEVKWITKRQFDLELMDALADINLSERQRHCLNILKKYTEKEVEAR